MDTEGGRFLSENKSTLVDSKPVQYNAEQKDIESSPEEQVASWVDTAVGIHTKHWDNPKVMGRIKQYYYDKYVIKDEDFPESHFINQQRLDRELGYGHIEITDRYRRGEMNAKQKDQKQSLDVWLNYLSSPNSNHLRTWTKYWAFEGVLKLGRYNKETKEFEPRLKDTVAPFVELNAEALSYALSTLEKKYGKEYFELTDKITEKDNELKRAETLDRQKRILELVDEQGSEQTGKVITVKDEQTGRVMNVKRGDLRKMREEVDISEPLDSTKIKSEIEDLTNQRSKVLEDRGVPQAFSDIDSRNEDFGKLYAYAINEVTPIAKSEKEIVEGQWVKYEQGSDHMKLYNSLQGHGTGWCTAGGEGMAQRHLEGGDFYVYYSNDSNGKPIHPRIAIRMEGDKIAEIRGVEGNQELDSYMVESGVLEEKLEEFGDEGDRYRQRVEDMKRMTEIEKKVEQGEDLTKGDILFLYEVNREIEGFGYEKDPRIEGVRSKRGMKRDFAFLVDYYLSVDLAKDELLSSEDIDDNLLMTSLIAYRQKPLIEKYLYNFSNLEREIFYGLVVSLDCSPKTIVSNMHSFVVSEHGKIAEALMDMEETELVATHISNFVPSEHLNIANMMLDHGEGLYVAKYLDSFLNLDHVVIANRLIDDNKGNIVLDYLENFSGLDGEMANALIPFSSRRRNIAKYIESFIPSEHGRIASALIDVGEEQAVVSNLSKFVASEHGNIVKRLIDSEKVGVFTKNLSRLSNLDLSGDIVDTLISLGYGEALARNMGSFSPSRRLEIASSIIKKGGDERLSIRLLLENLDIFSQSDCNEIVNMAIETNAGSHAVVSSLDKLPSFLTHKDIAYRLIDARKGEILASNLNKFSGLDHVDIANRLIDSRQGRAIVDKRNWYDFKGLDHVEIANRLIDTGQAELFIENIDQFSGVYSTETVRRIIDSGQSECLKRKIFHFSKLRDLDNDTAYMLVDHGLGNEVMMSLYSFPDLVLDNFLAKKLIDNGAGLRVIYDLFSFSGVNHKELAHHLIDSGYHHEFADNLYRFQRLDSSIANILLDKHEGSAVAENLSSFTGLDGVVANRLIDNGHGRAVVENLSSFVNLDSSTLERLKEFQG